MSALEREEMDRQLDGAKTELFAEQRRARERLESMQEVLCQSLLYYSRMTIIKFFTNSDSVAVMGNEIRTFRLPPTMLKQYVFYYYFFYYYY